MKRPAVLSLAALLLASSCIARRTENREEQRAAIGNARGQLGDRKQEVDRKLAATSDPAEREALLAEQRRIAEELRRLDEWERNIR